MGENNIVMYPVCGQLITLYICNHYMAHRFGSYSGHSPDVIPLTLTLFPNYPIKRRQKANEKVHYLFFTFLSIEPSERYYL